MKDFLLSLKDQARQGVKLGGQVQLPNTKKIAKVLFSGMGGSAIGGDLVREAGFRSAKVPFIVNRTSHLPSWVDSETLVVLSSYSGNTQEVLDVLHLAQRVKPSFLIITSGGQLAEFARKKKLKHIIIPAGMPPRCAIGYMSFPLLACLSKNRLAFLRPTEMSETISVLGKAPIEKAKQIAQNLANRSVHFYAASGPMEVVVTRWRAQLAENAKMLASGFLMPEMFHNEVEGWCYPKNTVKESTAVFFLDRDDPSWIEEKRRTASRLIEKHGGKTLEIHSKGTSVLARIYFLIQMGDWVSYELAKIEGVDPIAIPAITAIKKIG